jgi:hypothetical protein
MARPSMTVTGTTLNPSDISVSYADSSSSTFLTVKARCSRERNSFTRSQLSQCDPVYTMISCAMIKLYVD